MYDIIIIGSGPAGMTSAIYAARAGKKAVILEKTTYGGKIINTEKIENYPGINSISGFDYATNLYNQVKNLNIEVKYENVLEVQNSEKNKIVKTSKSEYISKTIILAIGSINRTLELKNVDKFISKGISYCATCDGTFYKNKKVAVVGGGNTAISDALYLSDICETVYLIHRKNTFRAEETLVNKLKEKTNVKYILESNITDLIGNETLEQIEINNNQLLEVSGLFIAIGQKVEPIKIKDLETNEQQYIKVNKNCETNIKGIFAAGDCVEKDIRQLTTATSDGTIAALKAIEYINER